MPYLTTEAQMYSPKHFEESDPITLQELIAHHPLGTWTTWADGELMVNHIPFHIDSGRGANGTLVGHVARANPIWKKIAASSPAVVVFQGPQTYITPSWFPSKHLHGKAVPTWNYAVVHAHGEPIAIHDKDWLLAHVRQLSDTHEASQALPWQVSDAPVDYIDKMLDAIVGIEIPIRSLQGKWKVSQNKQAADRLGTIAGLSQRSDPVSKEMAELIDVHMKA
ncbi:MAG: FMN-binding negative transcriptional regulator [Burkholderiaceae bacterium]